MSFARLVLIVSGLITIYNGQIIDDSIPLHEIPNSVTNELNDIGMKVWFDILTETLEIVITMITNENQWMGVGFGGQVMKNRYALTWELDTNTNQFGLFERILNQDNEGVILAKIDESLYKQAVQEGEQAVQYIRAWNPNNDGDLNKWVLYPNATELQYIMAHGDNEQEISYHGNSNRLSNTITLKQVPPKSLPIICQNETTGCSGKIIECKSNEDCNVICGINENDPYACYESTIICPSDYNCNITCAGYHACDTLTIHSEDSNILNINDCITGSNTCKNMQIYCPERYDETNPYHCIINSGDKGLFDIDIYNIMGLKSMKYIGYIGDDISIGNIHCGLEYPYQCKITNNNDITQCLNQDNNDITCDNPPISYHYCKGAQDQNGGGNCLKQTIQCDNDVDCYVYCGRDEFDKYPCAQANINCPNNKKCMHLY